MRFLKKLIDHSSKRRPPLFFHLDNNTAFAHVLVHSVDKTHVLVVTVELIWLLFFNIISFSKFQNIQKNLCKLSCSCSNQSPSKLSCFFDLVCTVQSSHLPLFCSCLSPSIVHLLNLLLLSTPIAGMLFTPRWVRREKRVKYLFIR